MDFEWDVAKSERNQLERDFDFEFASLIFAGPVVAWPDGRWNYGEARVRAVGKAGNLLLHVVFTDRGDTRRIISARVANRKERLLWLSHV